MARHFYVYVIQLDPAVCKKTRFRAVNPRMTFRAECFYVGSSVRKPDHRFEQHKQGYKANRYTTEFGLHLRPDIYEQYNPIPSRKDAEELERYLAERLRAQGYGVWQG